METNNEKIRGSMKYKIHSIKSVKIGDRFKVVGNLSKCKKGDILISEQNSSTGMFIARKEDGIQITVYLDDGTVERIEISKKEIERKLESLKDEITELEDKLLYIKETGRESLDEEKYIRYKILQTINSDSSPDEKEDVIETLLERQRHGSYYSS